jgi:hypothetical protein
MTSFFDALPKPLRWIIAFACIGAVFFAADYLFEKFSDHLK